MESPGIGRDRQADATGRSRERGPWTLRLRTGEGGVGSWRVRRATLVGLTSAVNPGATQPPAGGCFLLPAGRGERIRRMVHAC